MNEQTIIHRQLTNTCAVQAMTIFGQHD